MKNLIVFIFIFVFVSVAYSALIPQPPIIKDINLSQYLKSISDNLGRVEVVITNPDGSRRGKYGDIVLLNNGGTYYAEFCVSSPNGTTWVGVVLSNTP